MCLKYVFFVIAVVTTFSAANGMRVTFEDCVTGEKMVSINYAEIKPCNEEPCIVHSGQDATVMINFDAIQDAATLTASVFVVNEGRFYPFPLGMPNACENAGLTCPMTAGTTYTYEETVTVPMYARKMAVTLAFKLQNGKDEDYLCAMAPVILSGKKV
ncbi:ecdysteroid-regulated 16 kDa protein-like [Apostichopus japonicus]|uniref:ecdysteroid-regulated 16 kDa protein-like n=1 Tax=Stichopus japonicus TaxID=307972 RepID=UPI003AB434AF